MTQGALIFEKMALILKNINPIEKDQVNQAQKFKFRGIEQVMNELHVHMANSGVFLTSEVLELQSSEKSTKSGGTAMHYVAKVKYSFFAVDGSSVSTISYGEAMDSGDKGLGKAMSYALKVALLQTFMVPTKDLEDPDQDSHELGSSVALPQASFDPSDPKCKAMLASLSNALKLSDPWKKQHGVALMESLKGAPMKELMERTKTFVQKVGV